MTKTIGLRVGAGQRVAIVVGGVATLLLSPLLLDLAPDPAVIVLAAMTAASLAAAAAAIMKARRLTAQAAKL